MIVGSLHLRNVRRVGKSMFSTESTQQSDDVTRFDFAGQTPLEVVGMLESVLGMLRVQFEAAEAAEAAEQAKQDKVYTSDTAGEGV